jgi:hypothetical protein
MGKIRKPTPVKLIVGFIFREEAILKKAELSLKRNFGKIDFQSETLVFNYTDYYQKELGKNLLRKFISFQKLIDPGALAEIKLTTNKIEEKLGKSGLRRINIDPGYLDLSKLVLATTKDYAHRIYLKKGIYAEATLVFQDKRFQPWPWTYPDYRTNEYTDIFNEIRNIYAQNLSCLLKRCPGRNSGQDS